MTQHSFFGQDLWVARRFGRAKGYYVDIGAGHYRLGNNTYLLETLGWCGVLVEPRADLAAEARLNRQRCRVEEVAVCARNGPLNLVEPVDAPNLTHVRETSADPAQYPYPVTQRQVNGLTPEALLARCQSPPVIDYLSVNAPGSEVAILRSFPWTAYTVDLVSVAHRQNVHDAKALDLILLGAGFCHCFPCPENPDETYYQRRR